jgi:hypothetical protein
MVDDNDDSCPVSTADSYTWGNKTKNKHKDVSLASVIAHTIEPANESSLKGKVRSAF